MAESALFKSYRDSQNAKAERALDEALGRIEAQEQAQAAGDEESRFQSWYAGHASKLGLDPNPDAPEHKYDYRGAFKAGVNPGPDGHWDSRFKADDHPNRFVDGIDTKTGQPQKTKVGYDAQGNRLPGVFESIKRGVAAVPNRVMEGIDTLGGVIKPNTPAERGEAPVDPSGLELQDSALAKVMRNPLTRTLLGGLDVIFPFSAFAGETGGDAMEWLHRASGELTDAKLKAALAAAKEAESKRGDDPSAPAGSQTIEKLLAIPEAQRLEAAREAGSMSAEILAGFIPGYTGVAKGVKALAGGGKVAKVVESGMKALPPAPGPGIKKNAEGVFVAPGQVRDPRYLTPEMFKPEHKMTQTALVERALEERRAMERKPLALPAAGESSPSMTDREILRDRNRTPLDAGDSEVSQQIIDATATNGGSTYSPRTGFHPGDQGYAVSIAPERGRVIKGEVRPEDITSFVKANEDLLQDERAFVGTWRDENGRTHLDVSIVTPDKGEALEIGRKYRQLAIYDFQGGKSVDVPNAPKGVHPYTAPAEPLTEQDVKAARMYDAAVTDPNSKPAWDALAREVDKDFEEISKTVKIEKVTGQPYANADEMAEDIKRGVMKVTTDNSEHPFWSEEQNWKFRAVHDYRGHFETGNDFSLGGEFKAWRAHDEKILDPAAKQALEVEVYGQAASAQANGGKFPEQKAFLPKDTPEGGTVLPELKDRLAGAPEARAFDPQAYASEKGLTYQGQWGGADMHEFREDKLTGGGNFTVEGPLTREGVDSALASHYERFGVKPQGEVGDPLAQAAAEARERLKTQWEIVKAKFRDETGALNPRIGIELRGGNIGDVLSRQTMNDLVTVGTEILWSGARSFQRWSGEMIAQFGDEIRPFLKDLHARAGERIKKVLAKSPDMKSTKEVLKYFHDGEFGAGWYDKAAEELRSIFGENADLYANIIAATSPQQTVAGNVTMANKAMEMILSGERGAHMPFRPEDGFIDAHLQNLNRILSGQPLSGPKVGNFARAIMGDKNAVVVDTWMLRAFGFAETGKAFPKIDPTRDKVLFIEKAVKDIAADLGIDPRQVQAAIWVGKKLEAEGPNALGTDPLHQMVRAKLVEDPVLARMVDEARGRKAVGEYVDKTADEIGFSQFSKIFDELGEEGRVSMQTSLLLARAAVGAAIGAAAGEDPEQKAFIALLAAGAGSVASRDAARKIWAALRDSDALRILKDESGAINPQTPGQKLRAERMAARQAKEPMPNVTRMDASREVKQTARAINDRLSEMRRLLRDKTLTHDETLARAANSKYRDIDAILAQEKGTTYARPEDGVAARDTRDLVIEGLLEQAAKAKQSGDPAEMAAVRERAKIAAKVSESVTDATTVRAQAQEAQKIPSKASRAKTVDYDALAKEMQDFQSGLDEALVSDKDLVDSLLEMGERAKAAKLLEDAKKAPWGYWKIYYGLNLFSTPLFHPKNFIGNGGALSLSIGARMVGETISYPFYLAGVHSIKGKPLVAPGETLDLILGAFGSVKDALAAGKSTWKTGESVFPGVGKYADRLDLLQAQRAIQQPGGIFPIFWDAMNRLAQKNLRFAGSTDEFFKVLSYAGEQRALARREAWKTAKNWGEAVELQGKYLAETPENIIRGAVDFAEYNTFTKEFEREPSRLLAAMGAKQSVMSKLEDLAAHPAMRLTLTPVFRTPMRIAEFGTEFTPVLNLAAPSWWKQAMGGGASAQLALGKIAVGTAMTYALVQYATAGLITGDWSKDPALRKRQQEGGFKPFSVYLPVVDKYVSYAGLGPIVAPIAAAAQYAQMGPHLKDENVATMFAAMTLASMETNLAMPYFDALNDFVQIFEAHDSDSKTTAGFKYIADRLRTHIPGAGAWRSLATITDGEVKDWKEFGQTFSPEWADVFNLFSSTAMNLPGFSRTVPAYRDLIKGEPIPLEGGPLPGLISTPTKDPVRVEILELGGAGLPKEIPRVIGGDKAPEGAFRVYAPKPGTVAPLSHEQRLRLTKLLTQDVKIDGMNLHAALTNMIVGPSPEHDEYMEESDGSRGGKALRIHELWNAYLDEAEARLLEEDKGLQETVRRAQAAKLRQLVRPGQRQEFDDMVEEAVR